MDVDGNGNDWFSFYKWRVYFPRTNGFFGTGKARKMLQTYRKQRSMNCRRHIVASITRPRRSHDRHQQYKPVIEQTLWYRVRVILLGYHFGNSSPMKSACLGGVSFQTAQWGISVLSRSLQDNTIFWWCQCRDWREEWKCCQWSSVIGKNKYEKLSLKMTFGDFIAKVRWIKRNNPVIYTKLDEYE